VDLKPLITLLAIVNPLACVPFFIHFTQGFSPAQRRRTVWMASVTVFIVIAASALVGYGLVIALVTALCLRLAGPIGRALGQTGINVMTRLMGLILEALAVEVMADGLQSLFPLLASKGGR
jgi:small neutral amino acid transporter SnatA (MarC family)